METVAGDTTIAHATAYATVLEALAGTEAPLRAQWLRALALELERLANHTGDLGALANDVAFLPTSAACGKIRGDFLNLTALLCGNRFGRGLVRPGGCRHDLDTARSALLLARLTAALTDVEQAVAWLWDAATARSRFENVGTVFPQQATEIGLVGPAARACGLVRDVRYDHPAGWHRLAQTPVAVWPGGDVFARARVRSLELQRSGDFLREQLAAPADGDILTDLPPPAPDTLAVALVEGWRGEVCHVALTNAAGRFRPLQNRRPILPQLDRPRPRPPRPGRLRFPDLQQELQPLLLRLRPLIRPTLHVRPRHPHSSPETRLRDDGLPARPRARAPRPPRWRPACRRREMPRRLLRLRARLPHASDHASARRPPSLSTSAAAYSAPTASPPARPKPLRRRVTIAWPSAVAKTFVLGSPGTEELRLGGQLDEKLRRLFGRSLRLRQVSAGGCAACEADVNVLGTIGWDLGRFGIQFVASPRHADGLLITGPVSRNMELALRKTWDAVPEPKIVIAVGRLRDRRRPLRRPPRSRQRRLRRRPRRPLHPRLPAPPPHHPRRPPPPPRPP
jgi:Ni,Fe-hydrogenase III large subunit